MSTIYFIPGLGANEMAFSKIGEVGFNKKFIRWMSNLENESVSDYAHRLIKAYHIDQNDIVAGLSFGGLLAQEISRILGQKEVILISSFRDKSDLKTLYQKSLHYGIHLLMPNFNVPVLEAFIAGTLNSGTKESNPVLKKMLQETDFELMKWSLIKIANSSRVADHNTKVYNIIGDQDRIVKLWKNSHTSVVKGGSHFMVYDKAEKITGLIRLIIDNVVSTTHSLL